MNTLARVMIGGFLLLGGISPSFAQGVYETPPAPNSSESMPQSPESAPLGARTLVPGATGMRHMGTLSKTRLRQESAVSSNVGDSGQTGSPPSADPATVSNP